MDARKCLPISVVVLVVSTLLVADISKAQTYQANSENFVVYAASAQLAKKASILAEKYRKELSLDWLGYEIERWSERCPIYVKVDRHAGGETSFAFVRGPSGRSQPVSWQMKIYGPVDRLLDAVLPHEITHTIFATHFGRPLPRWADEGACTTVEHESERRKNHQMLISFLTSRPSRGIPFNRMFTMKQYPHDILPLYAQGYSVARYLIQQKGRKHFVQFLEKGMSIESNNYDTTAWDQATSEYYGYKNLSDLQISWEKWVRSGSPVQTPSIQVASNDNVVPKANLIDPQGTYAIARQSPPEPSVDKIKQITLPKTINGWYARESRAKQAVTEHQGNDDLQTNTNTPDSFRPGSLKQANAVNSNIQKLLEESSPKSTMWR